MFGKFLFKTWTRKQDLKRNTIA